MIHEITFPNTFDEYLNNTTGASSSRSCGAKLTPVKQWERDCFGSYCSCCGFYAYRDRFGQPIESKFCPNCGADLEGAVTDAKKRYIEVGKIPWRCAPNISPAEPFVTITDIKNMSDANVVEVVRCKDCRYSQFKEEPGWYAVKGSGGWTRSDFLFKPSPRRRRTNEV